MIILNSPKLGHRVKSRFSIFQHEKDTNLLQLIAKYLRCGKVYKHSNNAFVFQISKFADLTQNFIPLFKVHSIQRIQQLDFLDFFLVANLITEGKHLTIEGLELIRRIKVKLNTGRD
jgi:hypothetical protein